MYFYLFAEKNLLNHAKKNQTVQFIIRNNQKTMQKKKKNPTVHFLFFECRGHLQLDILKAQQLMSHHLK